MENENSSKNIIFNALLRRNPILVSGMVIAPVVITADSFFRAVTLAAAFSVITFFTLLISSFVPKRIVYTVRIIMYAFIGALVYVPSAIMLRYFIPDEIDRMGIFFPLLMINSFIISRSESIFFLESKGKMLLDIIFCIIGWDAAVILYGVIREIIGSGTVGGNIIGMPVVFSAFATPFGGFILLGIMAGLLRVVLVTIKRVKNQGSGGESPRANGGESPRTNSGAHSRTNGGEHSRANGGAHSRTNGGEFPRVNGGESQRANSSISYQKNEQHDF